VTSGTPARTLAVTRAAPSAVSRPGARRGPGAAPSAPVRPRAALPVSRPSRPSRPRGGPRRARVPPVAPCGSI